MQHIQLLASQIITTVLAGNNLTDTLQQQLAAHPDLSPQDRGALRDACYTTLRELGLWQGVLKLLLRKPLTNEGLQELLWVALAQLNQGRHATHAVVDHAVRACIKLGHPQAKGLVNAVLRNFLRQQDDLLAQAREHSLARWNHPHWWLKAMQRAYPRQWEAVLEANNQHPPMSLRVNARRSDGSAYLARLQEHGMSGQLLGSHAIRLDKPVPVAQLPGFTEGDVSVQDYGAQWAAQLLDVAPGMRVLDACAAPGGKTGHLLELADLELTALDSSAQRLTRVTENLTRLGQTAKLVCADAARPQSWWDDKPFDRILADVPCSASGVARRHPDIRWLRRPDDFAGFAQQQLEMLEALWPLLATGGKLLYATCSVFPQENAETVERFCSRHPDAARLPLPAALPADGQLLPSAEHDGFYYALLCKAATA